MIHMRQSLDDRRSEDAAGNDNEKGNIPAAPAGFDYKAWRKEYMRRYMRARRAREKAKKQERLREKGQGDDPGTP